MKGIQFSGTVVANLYRMLASVSVLPSDSLSAPCRFRSARVSSVPI
jgi:hypothetical protein